MMRKIELKGTTDSGGDLTVQATHKVTGLLIAVHWADGAFADGVDAVLSVEGKGVEADTTLLTITNGNDDEWFYPLVQADDNAGDALTTTGGEEVFTLQVVNGLLKLVVSNGGNTKAGGCVVYVEE